MGKQPKSLKTALQSTQHRLHTNAQQKASQAAKLADKKKTKGKGKQPIHFPSRPIIPFQPHDEILLIGEGNFSFARALLNQESLGLDPKRICATSYDSEDECYSKYSDARSIVSSLRESGVEVLFGIDATQLHRTFGAKGKDKGNERKWDRVVWNFPHAGKGITDMDRNIRGNQEMLLAFFKSVRNVLKEGAVPSVHVKRRRKVEDEDADEDEDAQMGSEEDDDAQKSTYRGTVLITLRNVTPYTLWDVPTLAKKPPRSSSNPIYTQLRSFVFQRDVWRKFGYDHRMTKGERKGGLGTTGQGGEDRTWEFCLRDL